MIQLENPAVPALSFPLLFEERVRRCPGNLAVILNRETLSFEQLDERANRLTRLLTDRGAGPERIVALMLYGSVDIIAVQLAIMKTGAAFLPMDYPRDLIAFMLDDPGAKFVVISTAIGACDTPVIMLEKTAAEMRRRPGPRSGLARMSPPVGASIVVPPGLVHQTVAALAPHVSAAVPEPPGGEAATGPVPLTPVQRWFFETQMAHPRRSNQSLILDLDGDGIGDGIDPAALRKALTAVLDRHDALRCRFERRDGRWRQHCIPAVGCGAMVAAEPDFDLGQGPLLAAALVGGRSLRLTAHHLVVDALSWRILTEDLCRAYRQAARGVAVDLGPKTTSFSQWARRLAEHTAAGGFDDELDHWAAVTGAATGIAVLPTDGAGRTSTGRASTGRASTGSNSTGSTRSVTVRLGAADTAALLRDVPGVYRTQVNDVLLAALADVLSRWTGRRRVVLDLEGHGREELFDDVDLSRTVGWFTTIFPVALDVPTGGWDRVLKSVKEQLRAVPRRGIGYGALRYLAGRTMLAHPLAHASRVGFNYLGQLDGSHRELKLTADPDAPRAHVLDVVGKVERGCLELSWFYSRDLHAQGTIWSLAEGLVTALREIVRHCARPGAGGRTPSDFPLARLDQDTVDRLAGDGHSVEDIYPLTPMQAGMAFHGLSQGDQGVYFQQVSFVLDGAPDSWALTGAWQRVVDQTPILRSSVVWEGVREPLQVVHRTAILPVSYLDWTRDCTEAGEERRRQLLQQLLARDRAEGLDLRTAPLMRLTLARLSATEVQVLWTFHHVLLDGRSVFQVLGDVFAHLAGEAEPQSRPQSRPRCRRPFRDYIQWLGRQRRDHAEAAERHWRGVLGDMVAPTPLPYSRPNASRHSTRSAQRCEIELTARESTGVYEFGRRHRLTPSTLVQGAWAILLSRYSGRVSDQPDVCFGATVSRRPAELAGADTITGIFTNTLPVRVRVDGRRAVADWLRDLQAAQAQSRRFEQPSLTQLQSWSGVAAGTPLFDSVVTFENYPIETGAAAAHGLALRDLQAVETLNFPLSATVYPGERLRITLGYEPDLFDAATVRQLGGHLRTLLTELVADPDRPLSQLPMLDDAERHLVLTGCDDTALLVPQAGRAEG